MVVGMDSECNRTDFEAAAKRMDWIRIPFTTL
jgi:hypothetical protein